MKALYDHTIELIELTKLLEREVCDTMTVTNYLGHDVAVPGVAASWSVTYDPYKLVDGGFSYEQTPPVYVSPTKQFSTLSILPQEKVFKLPEDNVLIQYHWGTGTVTVTSPSGETILTQDSNVEGSVNLVEEGTYIVQYELKVMTHTTGSTGYNEDPLTCFITIASFKTLPNSTPWTITDVVNRLLTAGVTRRIGLDAQRYVFDSEQATKYANVLAPEFFFTRGTLWDALSTVGGFIHAIPRLVDQNREDGRLTVRFDELNSDEEYDMSNLPSVRYYDEQISGEEYCEEIDSPAQNLLNTTDKATGAVTEPSNGGWRAVNCPESDYEISANTMTFPTDQPFYQVTGLEVKWGQNGTALNAFPYLYEAAEYRGLSGYEGETYPYSKAYALCYSQGGKEITGLNFVIEDAVSSAYQSYAIVNILKALGVDINNDADFANNLFYRITYIPQSELRVTQKKPYLTHVGKGTLIYNQGGNTIESEYFGQKMKGAIARIGNVIRRRTFICNKFVKVPKIGQTYSPDGVPEKISNVDCSYEKLYIKVTVTSVPNFNRLAEYTGVNSNYRLYDISEKQSVDRFVHYEESCVISNKKIENTGSPMITGGDDGGLAAYKSMFTTDAEADNNRKVTAAFFNSRAGRTEEDAETGVTNNPITLACASFGFGNSLVFYANMQDNYGAGRQSSDDYWQTSTKKRTSKQVQYSDGLGNISTMDVTFGTGFTASDSIPFNYPQGVPGSMIPSLRLLDSASHTFYISKDSREAIHFSYQLHHQADTFDIVIGNGLSKFNPLVSAKRKALRFIWLTQRPLDLINPKISAYYQDPNFPTATADADSSKRRFSIGAMTNPTGRTVYGWAIVAMGEIGGIDDIVVGQNYPSGLENGATTKPLYFNFVDNSILATLGMAE